MDHKIKLRFRYWLYCHGAVVVKATQLFAKAKVCPYGVEGLCWSGHSTKIIALFGGFPMACLVIEYWLFLGLPNSTPGYLRSGENTNILEFLGGFPIACLAIGTGYQPPFPIRFHIAQPVH